MKRIFPPERQLPAVYRFCYYGAVLAVGFGIGDFLWDRISLPFSNAPGVTVGRLVDAGFSPLNNTVRYFALAGMPALLYLGLSLLLWGRMPLLREPKSLPAPLAGLFERLALVLAKHKRWIWRINWLLLLFLALSGILRFLSLPFDLRPFDVFHEGESLTPAFVYMRTGALWKGTFFLHGVLYDPLVTVFSWKFFGVESVGAARLGFLFSHAVMPLAFVLYVLTISRALGGSFRKLSALLLAQILILAFIYTDATGEGTVRVQMLDRRDLPVLLALCALHLALLHRSRLWLAAVGLGSAANYAYTLDRGAYFTTFLFVLMALFIVFPRGRARRAGFADAACVFGGMILGWTAFVAIFGWEEVSYFLLDAREVYATASLFAGFVYRRTFLYLVPILLIGVQVLFLAVWFLGRYLSRPGGRVQFYIHVSLTCLAVLHFRTALGRGDIAHLFYSSTFAYIGVAFLLWTLARRMNRRYIYALMVVLLALNARKMATIYKRIKPAKIAAYVRDVRQYVELDDSLFVQPEARAAVADMKKLFANEPGIFNYSSDAVLPYLLKKPPVGRNFVVWFSSSRARRAELQRDLLRARPRYIVYSGLYTCVDSFCNERRFPELHPYVLKHYAPFRTFGPWAVHRRIH